MVSRLSRLEALSLWLPVLGWAGVIFYFSSLPHLRIVESPWDWVLRKAAHMAVYGVLAILVRRAIGGSTSWPARRVAAVSLAAAIGYAISDEWHQSFVPGRGPSALDVAIDALGAWLALRLRSLKQVERLHRPSG